MNEEREHLDALLKTPGWHIFRTYVRKQWGGEGYGLKLKQAVMKAKAEGKDLELAVLQLDAANDAVWELIDWPDHAIRMIDEQEAREKAEPSMRRGGQP